MKLYSSIYNDFQPFDLFYPDFDCVALPRRDTQFSDPGILIIWGGSDIHPSLYNRPNYASHVGDEPSSRDVVEVHHISQAIERGIPIIGVCRGAQLGCAAAGGFLIQHVDNHCEDHFIETTNNKKFLTSSLHHQMMYPWTVDHKLLAWSAPSRATSYHGVTKEESEHIAKHTNHTFVEPEVVWFPKIKCLAIQGHPEFMDPRCAFNLYVQSLIDEFILSK